MGKWLRIKASMREKIGTAESTDWCCCPPANILNWKTSYDAFQMITNALGEVHRMKYNDCSNIVVNIVVLAIVAYFAGIPLEFLELWRASHSKALSISQNGLCKAQLPDGNTVGQRLDWLQASQIKIIQHSRRTDFIATFQANVTDIELERKWFNEDDSRIFRADTLSLISP